ncbi:conserved protein of unknown function [Kingella kingae]|nr:conserved protein of unknown function [Kingella kingae]
MHTKRHIIHYSFGFYVYQTYGYVANNMVQKTDKSAKFIRKKQPAQSD